MKWLSFLLIVGAGSLYQVCANQTASDINPFVALMVTYIAALCAACILFLFTKQGASLVEELRKINWYSVILGIVICGYEFGFILAYRYGFTVGRLSPMVAIATMIVLAIVGIFAYHEKMSPLNIAGLLVAAIGVSLTIK